MNIRNHRLYLKICTLFLTIVLLLGCSRSIPKATENTIGSLSTMLENSDQQANKIQIAEETQKKFESLTNQLFYDQVTESTINLHYTLRNPKAYEIENIPITFGNFTLDHMKEDIEKYKKLKSDLEELNSSYLTADQLLTYEILLSTLEKELALEGFELYAKPLAPTIGVQAQLPVLLAEYTFYERQDIEDYLTLLSQIGIYYEQIIEFEKQKSLTGLFMSDYCVDQVILSCSGYLVDPSESFLNETFLTRLALVEGLTDTDISTYQQRNLTILEENFIPAYKYLIEQLELLKGTGKNDQGISYYPNGTQYYQALIHSSIGPSYHTVDELKMAIEQQMARDLKEIVEILNKNPDILEDLDTYEFSITNPEEILEVLSVQIQKDFPQLPECNYTVKYVPKALEPSLSPAFYLTPPIDQFENNTIYINNGITGQSKELFPILAHEGYPGHLYQTVYFTNSSNSNLRRILPFSSYTEGWAVYVENYSYSLENGLNAELGRFLSHNSTSMLGLHALLELNINYYGWTIDQVKEYLSTYYAIEDSSVITDLYQTMVANPTNYLEYYVGYLEIENLKNKAESALKNNFNLLDFHTFLLEIGPAPFDIINNHFNQWLDTKSN